MNTLDIITEIESWKKLKKEFGTSRYIESKIEGLLYTLDNTETKECETCGNAFELSELNIHGICESCDYSDQMYDQMISSYGQY